MIGREVAAISETTLRDLEERSNAVIGSLQDRSSSMLSSLQQRTMELTAAYLQSTQAVRTALDEGTEQTVVALTGANERLRGELADVLGRLNDANRLLQQVAASASGNLGAVEDGLAGRVQHIEALLSEIATQTGRASDQVADQVDALRSVSSGAIQQALELAQNLEERGRALTDTTGEQMRTLTEAAAALERVESAHERGALWPPAGPGRASRPHQRPLAGSRIRHPLLHRPSSRGSLQNAEAKARQIGSVLAAAAETTTGAIGEQFERIRATTGEESERTAAALRTGYEQAAAEMAEALGNATAKFRDTMGEIARHDRPDPARAGGHPRRTAPRRRRAAAGDPGDDGQHAPRRRRPDQGSQRALRSGLPLQPDGRCGSGRPAPQGRVNETPVAATMAAVAAAVEQRIAQTPAPARHPGGRPPGGTEARSRSGARPRPPRHRHLSPGPAGCGASDSAPGGRPAREAGARGGWLSDLLNRASREETVEPTRAAGRPDRSREPTASNPSIRSRSTSPA